MFENRKEQWLQNFFKKNALSINGEAVAQILDMLDNDTETLRSECSKFFYCFPKGHAITSADVDKILVHNREENAFTLFEAMADTSRSAKLRLETSMEILQKIRLSKDASGVMLIAGLTYCFRQLRAWHILHSSFPSPTEAQFRTAGFIGKTNRTRYQNAAKLWNVGTTASIIALLSSTDMSIREGGASMETTLLTMMIYSIVIKNGLFCATYE